MNIGKAIKKINSNAEFTYKNNDIIDSVVIKKRRV